MKINISVYTILMVVLLWGISQCSYAQAKDTLVNKDITVTRAYQPNIQNTNKIVIAPIKEAQPIRYLKPKYAQISAPLNAQYNVHVLLPKSLQHIPNVAKNGFARLGIGTPMNTLADVMLPILEDEKNRLDMSFKHLGAFAEKKHSSSSLSLQYNHLFDNFDFYTMLVAKHDFFNYYGQTFVTLEQPIDFGELIQKNGSVTYNTPEKNTLRLREIGEETMTDQHIRIHAGVGIRSLPLSHALNFDAGLNYRQFQTIESGIVEHEIHLKGAFEVPTDENKLGMNVEIYNFNYENRTKQLSFDDYALLKINPYYRLVGENWWLRIGAKTGISIGAGQIFTPSPDLALQWSAIPRYLAIFAGATGNVTVNSLDRIYGENRYLSPKNRITDTYTPLDMYAGVKISPTNNLILDLFGQYKIISNPYFYVNRHYQNITQGEYTDLYHNRFDIVYGTSPSEQLSVGGRIGWDYQELINIYIKGAYHSWNVKNQYYAWQMPKWDTDFGASVKITNDIVLHTQFLFEDGRYALLKNSGGVRMKEILDWNMGGAYTYTDDLSFFVKINNILNQKYEHFKGYQVQGFNTMLGVTFTF